MCATLNLNLGGTDHSVKRGNNSLADECALSVESEVLKQHSS